MDAGFTAKPTENGFWGVWDNVKDKWYSDQKLTREEAERLATNATKLYNS